MKKIDELVKSAKANVLGEAFLITAVESYCRQVLADDSDWGKSLVSKEAWQLIAKHNLNLIEGDKNGLSK
jgi:ATP/maltotriose-dependent transcriptional regulator MalT